MPKGMHLVRGMTSLNLKKPKVKITKKRMFELKEEHRLYNKKCKQTNNRKDMMSLDDYIDRQFGKVKYKPKNTGTYQGAKTDIVSKKIPSLTTTPDKNACARKEPKVYDGERKLIGIGILHKSNLVPIFDEEHAKDLAKMRR